MKKETSSPEKVKVALALQAGGAHGAFTWGVLDRLLDDERIEIVGVSGASAGSINGVLLSYGLRNGDRLEAKRTLRKGWEAVSFEDLWDDLPLGFIGKNIADTGNKLRNIFPGKKLLHRAEVGAYGGFIASLRPILDKMGPRAQKMVNQLLEKRIDQKLETVVDFAELRKEGGGIPLFVAATDIHASQPKIFKREEMKPEMIRASSSIPFIFPPTVINGREYFDGALSENPAIDPLLDCDCNDIMIVQTVPMIVDLDPDNSHSELIKTVQIIMNATMRKDVQHIQKTNAKIDKHPIAAATMGYKKIHTHLINDKHELPRHDIISMLYFGMEYMEELREIGYKAADEWLKENHPELGKNSTFTATADTTSRKSHLKKETKQPTTSPPKFR